MLVIKAQIATPTSSDGTNPRKGLWFIDPRRN
jgi:hypothetical protein